VPGQRRNREQSPPAFSGRLVNPRLLSDSIAAHTASVLPPEPADGLFGKETKHHVVAEIDHYNSISVPSGPGLRWDRYLSVG
jgi:hypothetical protein